MFRSYFNAIANYVNFTGVATRSQFWWFQLQNFIIVLILYLIATAAVASNNEGFIGFMGLVFMVYYLFMILPSLSIGARRLRDAGYSPWLLLVILIPFVGGIVLIVLWCMPSKVVLVEEQVVVYEK